MAVTDGLTLTNTFDVGAIIGGGDVDRGSPAVFSMSFTGLTTDEGMIYEQGGATVGSWVGIDANGDLLVRCCRGGGLPHDDVAIGTASGVSGDGDLDVEFTPIYDAVTQGRVRAWWNDVLVIDETAVAGRTEWAGSNQGHYLSESSSTTNGQVGTPATYTTASALRYYENQTVGSSTAPSSSVDATMTGVSVTTTAGDVVADISTSVSSDMTGVQINTSAGSVEFAELSEVDAVMTGVSIGITAGDVSLAIDGAVDAQMSPVSLSITAGTVDLSISSSVDADMSGVFISIAAGSVQVSTDGTTASLPRPLFNLLLELAGIFQE